MDHYSRSGCSDYFSECVFGAKLGFRKVSYNPNAIGMQKVKIEHAQGFVMINPDKPLEFVEALIKIDPNLSVEGFEQIKTN